MKRNTLFLSLCMLAAGWLMQACSSEDMPTVPEEPKEIEPWFNPTDSLIALEVWKQAGGPGWRVKWDPQDIMTWLGTGWYVDEETKECRLWHLYINFPPDESVVGTLSPKLGELTELRLLSISGTQITGPIPSEIGNLKHLEQLDIQMVGVTGEIPGKIFLLPNLKHLNISSCHGITGELPKEMAQISPDIERCYLADNNLHGKVPSGIRFNKCQVINLNNNCFTEYPFEYCKIEKPMINMRENYITGAIPDSILQDKEALKTLKIMTGGQKGEGFTNIPEGWDEL